MGLILHHLFSLSYPLPSRTNIIKYHFRGVLIKWTLLWNAVSILQQPQVCLLHTSSWELTSEVSTQFHLPIKPTSLACTCTYRVSPPMFSEIAGYCGSRNPHRLWYHVLLSWKQYACWSRKADTGFDTTLGVLRRWWRCEIFGRGRSRC
jgi:hypothetical protein